MEIVIAINYTNGEQVGATVTLPPEVAQILTALARAAEALAAAGEREGKA